MPEKRLNEKEKISIDGELIRDLSELLNARAFASVKNIFEDLHPADIAEILSHLDTEERQYAFTLLHTEVASEVILELDDEDREEIIETLEPRQIGDIVDEMESDDAADLVGELDEAVARDVLKVLDEEDKLEVQELLRYDEESAGGIMGLEYTAVHEQDTVQNAIEEIRKKSTEVESIFYVFVTSDGGVLTGVVSVDRLILAGPQTLISQIMDRNVVYAETDEDQEQVAMKFKKYDLVAMPVVTPAKKLVGRITIDDIVDIIEEEATEDASLIAGSIDEDVTETSVFKVVRARVPWLLTGLAGEILVALTLSQFERSITEILALTFFIPIMTAMGGNAAIQSSSIVIRGLATGDINLLDMTEQLMKELKVAFINGFLLSLVLFGSTYLWIDDLKICTVIGASLFFVIFLATFNGALFPLLLKRLNFDPALSTGPFVTTTNDALGIIVYLGIATLVLLS